MKIILSGGGTAGHINPALSIAQIIRAKNPDADILFIGNQGSLKHKLVTAAGFEIKFIKVSGIKRSLSLDNFKTAINFVRSVSDCKKIIKDFGADCVIGTGGYVSGPAVYAAQLMGVPTCIHEQNAFPGVTSKFLAKKADIAFLSFEGSEKYFTNAKKTVMTGNPLNSQFLQTDKKTARDELGIPQDATYVLSFAGSLGAHEVNRLFCDFIIRNNKSGEFYHTHATGSRGFKWMPDTLKENGFDIADDSRIQVTEYIYDMPKRLAAADIVVSRAGAITLGELCVLGKPSILIPSPNVTNNHQYHNAMSLVNEGAALILEEKDATPEKLYSMIQGIKNDKSLAASLGKNALRCAKPDAAEIIYKNVYNLIKK